MVTSRDSSLRCLVILPTYDERGNIEPLIHDLLELPIEVDVLVVDDGSPDGTGEIAADIAQREPRVRVINRPGKLGLGSAYLVGFADAISRGYDAVCTMDADRSHDPAYLPTMLQALADADIVIGSRYIRGGSVEGFGAARKLNSFAANTLARIASGLRERDMTSGYRVYRVSLLERMALNALESRGYSMLVELLCLASDSGARVVERPIRFKNRTIGRSKISLREIFGSIQTLSRLSRRSKRTKRQGVTG